MSLQDQEEIIDFLETESAGFADQEEEETVEDQEEAETIEVQEEETRTDQQRQSPAQRTTN